MSSGSFERHFILGDVKNSASINISSLKTFKQKLVEKEVLLGESLDLTSIIDCWTVAGKQLEIGKQHAEPYYCEFEPFLP